MPHYRERGPYRKFYSYISPYYTYLDEYYSQPPVYVTSDNAFVQVPANAPSRQQILQYYQQQIPRHPVYPKTNPMYKYYKYKHPGNPYVKSPINRQSDYGLVRLF